MACLPTTIHIFEIVLILRNNNGLSLGSLPVLSTLFSRINECQLSDLTLYEILSEADEMFVHKSMSSNGSLPAV